MVKIAVHYGTTFAVGAIATWFFQVDSGRMAGLLRVLRPVVYFERNEGWR